MIVRHELEVVCRCPVDDSLDRYAVAIVVGRTLPVEDILAAVEAMPEKLFQEDATAYLARTLGAAVVTRGTHSGIATTCSYDNELIGTEAIERGGSTECPS